MELKWLEDYLALVEYSNFSKAAESRLVTQPAFGRRIRSLEDWLGVELVDRQQSPISLTPVGREFTEQAQRWVEEFYSKRIEFRERVSATKKITFASQHSLTISFLPNWISTFHFLDNDTRIRINANDLHNCLDTLMSDQSDFLLCYHSPEIFPQLDRENVLSCEVGTDYLIPVSGVDSQGRALYEPREGEVLKLLNYPDESFFGRLLQRDYFAKRSQKLRIQIQCENSFAEGLKALAIKGNGVAWLPESAIKSELEQGTLIRSNDTLPSIKLRVMLYMKKNPNLKEIETIWDHIQNFA